ncbi:MAG: iron-containing alcohol dehydrogenase [Rickettsiales bacterium]
MPSLLSLRCRFSLPFSDVTLPEGANFPIVELAAHKSEVRRFLRAVFGAGFKALVVADENTYGAAKEFLGDVPGERMVFPDGLAPRRAFATQIKERVKEKSGVLAVGAGTVNDLCKAAAHDAGKPYAYLPTALSMNGLCSSNASIIEKNGKKSSVTARPPVALLFMPEIWKNAPPRLWKSGLADLSCYASCRFDWLLSHCLADTPYDETLFTCLRPLLPNAPRDVADLVAAKDEALLRLALALCVSGATMNAAGGSMPASQSEHLICHAFDMAKPRNLLLHGEKIAAAAAYTLALQRRFLQKETFVAVNAGRYRRAAYRSLALARRLSAFRPHVAFMKKTAERKAALFPNNLPDAEEKMARFFLAFGEEGKREHVRTMELYASPLFSRTIRRTVLCDSAIAAAAPLLRERMTILDLCENNDVASLGK